MLCKALHPSTRLSHPPRGYTREARSPLGALMAELRDITVTPSIQEQLIALYNAHAPVLDTFIREQHSRALQQGTGIDNLASRAAAQATRLRHALHACCDFLHHYDVRSPAADLQASITPTHRRTLATSFATSFAAQPALRQSALVSALAPRALQRLSRLAERHLVNPGDNTGDDADDIRLSEDEALALIDYVHADTGSFNALNAAALCDGYYQIEVFRQITEGVSSALERALHKLCRHAAFRLEDICVYKGIRLDGPDGMLMRAHLEHALHHQSCIAFPNFLSSTTDPLMSYATTKTGQGYTGELQMHVPLMASVDAFHAVPTIGQQEAMAPRGLRFTVRERSLREIRCPSTGSLQPVEVFVLASVPGGPGATQ